MGAHLIMELACWLLFGTGLPDKNGDMVARCWICYVRISLHQPLERGPVEGLEQGPFFWLWGILSKSSILT